MGWLLLLSSSALAPGQDLVTSLGTPQHSTGVPGGDQLPLEEGLCDGRAMLTLLEAGGCLISYLSHPVWDIIRASPQWQLALKHVEGVRGL